MNEKLSAAVGYSGGTTAFAFGLSSNEWQAIGVIGGLLIGLAGFAVSAYFQHQRLKLDRRNLGRGSE